MKKTKKITFCAMMAALASAFMLLSFFPYLTYAIPAIAGLFIMVCVIEYGIKWGTIAFIASLMPILLWSEPESRLMYVFLFGYYPILKAAVEKLRKPVIEWLIKVLIFNIAVLAVYLFFAELFGASLEGLGDLGKYGGYILLVLGNVVFVLYDITVSRMASFYLYAVRPKIKKMI